MVFENSTSGGCPQGFNRFQYISIGNNTATVVNTIMTEFDTNVASPTGCAVSGEVRRNGITLVSGDLTPAVSGTNAVVVLDTSSSLFGFDTGASNTCSESIPTSNIFSVQDLNISTGITVSSRDSLSVK